MQVEGNTIPGYAGHGSKMGGAFNWTLVGQAITYGAYYGLAIGLILADGPLPAGDAAAAGLLTRLHLASKAERGARSAIGFGMLAFPGESVVLTPAGIALGEFLENTIGSTALPGSHSMWVGPEVWWFYE